MRVFVGVCVRVCAWTCGGARARVGVYERACVCFIFLVLEVSAPVEKPNVHLHIPELSHVWEIPCCKLFFILF